MFSLERRASEELFSDWMKPPRGARPRRRKHWWNEPMRTENTHVGACWPFADWRTQVAQCPTRQSSRLRLRCEVNPFPGAGSDWEREEFVWCIKIQWFSLFSPLPTKPSTRRKILHFPQFALVGVEINRLCSNFCIILLISRCQKINHAQWGEGGWPDTRGPTTTKTKCCRTRRNTTVMMLQRSHGHILNMRIVVTWKGRIIREKKEGMVEKIGILVARPLWRGS